MSAKKSEESGIANTLEWLITAFMLAFLARAFVLEAFRIPTGSMADTLKGDHFRLRCHQCGYKYDCGFEAGRYRAGQDISGGLRPPLTRCPSCGYYDRGTQPIAVSNGDRILVLKCVYQFFEPKRWDVVVFKNPLDPSENYIKRLIGLPGETIEIIDGDVYIDGVISRKPAKIQEELWMPVYNNDYQPARPREGSFNRHNWQQPFKNTTSSSWRINETNLTEFHLESAAGKTNSLVYDTSLGNDFKATYAYDNVGDYDEQPYCSDLMVRLNSQMAGEGHIGIALSKYQTIYKAWVDSAGNMVIAKISGDEEIILNSKKIVMPAPNKPTPVKFADVDHQLIFEFGGENLIYDLGRSVEDAGKIRNEIEPQVEIFGSGKLTLSHVAIFRDIHYTAKKNSSSDAGRAIKGNPFTLKQDEFFVLGDNSPNSEDCRWWSRAGIGNNGKSYREGIVPRDYLVGKALLVYWPGGFEFPWPYSLKSYLFKNSQKNGLARSMYWLVSCKWIPNIGQIRFIRGGSGENQ